MSTSATVYVTSKNTNQKNELVENNFNDDRKKRLFKIGVDQLETKTELEGLRKTIFLDRYALKDEEGKAIEEYPEQMWRRVARGIAQFEETQSLRDQWEERFYRVMKDFKFVPGGRILSGAGTGSEVTFFNCYVIPSPNDSRGGIMENITHTVEIQSRGGGVGVNLSSLRPSGARVRKVNGTSSGPVNWASLYSTANHDVIQQGGSRRGALMLMINDWHPDVVEFIKVKEDLTKIPGANLSVCISDKFMQAVKNNDDWELVFPDHTDPDYDELWNGDLDAWRSKGKSVKVHETVKAAEIWKLICQAAWRSAEPGLHFLERSNSTSNTWYFEKLIATNPCGEQPLGEWSVCNLGAMNLSAYVKDGVFDYDALEKDAAVAMRFLDNVVDANFYFFQENMEAQYNIRRTGLGTMGLGDALIKLKVGYGSPESLKIVEKIYKTIRDGAYQASVGLAKEKGAFPKFDREKFLQGKFIERLPEEIKQGIAEHGIRNAVILTQAPTGTTSLLSGVSSGIEPNYDFEFKRSDRTGEHVIYHPLLEEWKKANPEAKEKPSYFVSAKELTPEEHVRVQAAIQAFTDSSISKTCNAPNSFTVEDVDHLYMLAYDLGCKGVTFFRDGSRTGVLESVTPAKEEKEIEEAVAELRLRPKKLTGSTYQVKTPVGTAFVVINSDDLGNPFEVFVNVGKAGTHVTADAEAIGRLVSLSLRVPSALPAKAVAEAVVEQLAGIGGAESIGFGNGKVRSLADGVAKVLREHLTTELALPKTNGHAKNSPLQAELDFGVVQPEVLHDSLDAQQEALPLTKGRRDLCPDCGQATLVLEEGCSKCYSCGASKC